MEIILLERVPKLGQMGDTVRVKDGYARNFLLPQGKALRATEDNRKRFETERAQLEARNLELKTEAEAVHEKLDGTAIVLIRAASANGQLYGSVSSRDIAEALEDLGFTVSKGQVLLHAPIKTLGMTDIEVRLHPEVESGISINVARSEEEAERQAAGEDVVSADRAAEREEDAAIAEFFEEGAFDEDAEDEDAGDATAGDADAPAAADAVEDDAARG
ncbi:MAG: 50S ribosomal protein L9 [Pseudomonadota bacterium]